MFNYFVIIINPMMDFQVVCT